MSSPLSNSILSTLTLLYPATIDEGVKIIFHTEDDDRVCAECEEHDGEEYEVDDPTRPSLPIHPNCRCYFVHSDEPMIELIDPEQSF